MSRLGSALPWMAQRVTRGRWLTAGGKSHSWLTPTRWSSMPSAATISVAAGSSETTRTVASEHGRRDASHRALSPRRHLRDKDSMAGRHGAETRGTARLLVTADAASRLDAARAYLEAFPPDAELLVVGASWDACADLVGGALGGACARFGVARTTLGRLATRLAAPTLAGRGLAPVSDLGLLAVVARAVHRLGGAGAVRGVPPGGRRAGR